MNRIWRVQQAKLATTQQKPAIDVHHDVIATEKPAVIHPATPVSILVNDIFVQNAPDTKDERFIRFVKIYKHQLKAGQAKPITVQRAGDKYRVLDGTRRLTAARVLKLPTITAIVQEGE